MKNILLLAFLLLTFGCSDSENEVYIQEFNWTLNIPNDFEDVPSKTRLDSQKKRVKMIESAYPDR
jgi:ABC-type Fe3+-citrate transport system substrate-binding protein